MWLSDCITPSFIMYRHPNVAYIQSPIWSETIAITPTYQSTTTSQTTVMDYNTMIMRGVTQETTKNKFKIAMDLLPSVSTPEYYPIYYH